MHRYRLGLTVILPLSLLSPTLAAQEPPSEEVGESAAVIEAGDELSTAVLVESANEDDSHQLRPRATGEALVEQARAAVDRGFQFLLQNQNKDGSFGSHDPKIANLKDFGFKLTNRGSQDGVRLACTAICAQAFLEIEERGEASQRALERSLQALLDPEKYAYELNEPFNTWGYGYKLDFLCRVLEAPESEGHRDRIIEAAELAVLGLLRYQQHEGGWGYYAGEMNDFESMSFNTAVFLVALDRAEKLGVAVPKGMVADAARCVRMQRVEDGSFVYSSNHIRTGRSRLMNLGAGSRTVACALGLYEVGQYDLDDLSESLRVFRRGENYLESGRKRIIPHSAPHAISGYFFFFGYYYATEVARILGDEVAIEDWERLAWQLVRTQESDGCWWDTASGHYGDKWGTGFALLSLGRYLNEMERRAALESDSEGAPAEGDDEGEVGAEVDPGG